MGQDLNGYKAKHEKSETVQKGKRWYNLDTVGLDKGRILGSKKGYATMKEAVSAAERRSIKYGKLIQRKKKR